MNLSLLVLENLFILAGSTGFKVLLITSPSLSEAERLLHPSLGLIKAQRHHLFYTRSRLRTPRLNVKQRFLAALPFNERISFKYSHSHDSAGSIGTLT